jgi:acetylornithine deacetylase/succinyl-diaminopimelate desuccinylase-like protein
MLAEILADMEQDWVIPVVFIANVCEEGLGDLRGIRAVFDRLPLARIGATIVLEGMALGRIYHAGIAVHRLKISAHAEGGHSWLHFGQPNAIHDLTRLCADISQIQVPISPRTTYSIGLIEGGQSINSIPRLASCYLDMRSTTAGGLQYLQTQVQAILERHAKNATFSVEIIGDRPAGHLDPDHELIRLASLCQQKIGLKPGFEIGSTDANYILSKGVPAVVVGISYGGNAHRPDEYIETAPLQDGFWSVFLLVQTLLARLRMVYLGQSAEF